MSRRVYEALMDFTISRYQNLVAGLVRAGYTFQSFDRFLRNAATRTVVLRHDVDLRPEQSLTFARLQHKMGISGVYYFRAVPESWDERIIREIAGMGHEIGYHYECLTTCKGNLERAIHDFEKNLATLRRLAPVSTICMHGSPLSKYDSKDLWKTYSYRDYALIGEPYFDVDFGKVAYLTDTGRRWDGDKVSVRDKVSTPFVHPFKTTNDIVRAADQNRLPEQIMFTFHPQRWTNDPYLWTKELLAQQIKNGIKRYFFVRK